MKLVVMTPSTFFVEEDKILTTLFEEGLENLHISKTDTSSQYMKRLLQLIPEKYHRHITLHHDFQLRGDYRLAGIHLSSLDAQPPLGYKGRIGRTCTDIMHLKAMRKAADYVFLGNLQGKEGEEGEGGESRPHTSLTGEELWEAKRQGLLQRNVYAIGQLGLGDVAMVKELGFGGMVVGDDLWRKFDIQHAQDFRQLVRHFRNLLKASD